MNEIAVENRFLVGADTDKQIHIGNTKEIRKISPNDALVLAAWLVAIAEPQATITFDQALVAVQNT